MKLSRKITPETLRRTSLYLSAILLGVIFNFRNTEILIIVAMIPLISYFRDINLRSAKQKRIDLFIYGLILSLGANFFMLQISTSNWTVAIRGWFSVVAPFLAWIMVSSFCALAWVAGGEIYKRNRILALPFLYAGIEILRSYLFAVMAYGPHGSLGPNFNWGSLGVPASGTNLVFVSPATGLFGLSAVVIFINIVIYVSFRKRLVFGFASLVVASCALSWPTSSGINSTTKINSSAGSSGIHYSEIAVNSEGSSQTKTLNVATVGLGAKENIADWTTEDWIDKKIDSGIDLLVLPEYSGLVENTEYRTILRELLSENGIAVTTRHNGLAPQGTNQIIFLDNQGDIIGSEDKTFLIPTGETLSYSLQMAFKMIGKKNSIVDFTYTQQVSPGQTLEKPFMHNGVSYGALACSGVGALNEYRRLSQDTDSLRGADVLINSASLSFLKTDSTYHVYADNMARFQAVSNKRPFVQASRSGSSFILVP